MKANVKSVLMKKYCRVYQAGAKLLMAALPWRSPKMLSGSGAVKKLPEAVRDRGFHKVLIVTGNEGAGITYFIRKYIKNALRNIENEKKIIIIN